MTSALARLECFTTRKAKGTHQAYHRVVDGRTLTGVVPLAKPEIPRGTLRSILRQLDIDEETFCEAL